jgi:CheY-like chemotaxis protein
MTVLYIEDDEDDLDIFKEAVQTVAPHTTFYSARDAKEGFKLLNKIVVSPDYIFLDINLPEMNGKEFLSKLKGNPGFKGIPVIVYSTSGNNSDINECKKLGAIDFIVKPNNFRSICELLKRYL